MRATVRNVAAALEQSAGDDGKGSTEIVVRQDPTVRAIGTSVKVGLILYLL
jgi:hypothetical protein